METPKHQTEEGLELLDIGVGIFDQKLRLTYCNPAFRDLRQYPENLCRDRISLQTLLHFNAERGDFGPGQADEQVAERIAEIETSEEREIEREMANGQTLSIRYRRTSSGGLVVTFQDCTAERNAQRVLEESEERYALVSRATSDGIYDWSVNEDELFISDSLIRILDFDTNIGTSLTWADRLHPDDLPEYTTAIRAHFKKQAEAVDIEYRVRTKGGEYRWVHDRGVGERDHQGRVVRLVGAIRDITEMREAQSELERTRSRLMASLSTISDGILLVDPEDRVELFNDRYVEIFGDAAGGADMSEIIVVGRSFFDMIRDGYNLGMFKPHRDGVAAWIKSRIKAWEQPIAKWELELSNGVWVLLNERRMSDGGRVMVYTDITEFKQREAQAQAASQRFEEAIEAISSGFALWDTDDRLVTSNTRYREYFADLDEYIVPGAVFTEIIAAGLERGFFPNAEGDIPAYLAGIAEKRQKAVGESREQFIHDMWLQVTDHRTKDGGIVSIYTDVTELKKSQLEIKRQSDVLKLTLENMGQGITMVDKDLNTIALNEKFLELMEFPAEKFHQGFTMEQSFRYNAERGEYGPGDVEEQVRERLELSSKFQAHRFERTRHDGTIIEVVGNPIEGGGFVSTYTDITERKRGEETLNAALAEFNAVLDNIDYGIFFMDKNLRTRIVNQAAGKIWNMTQEFVDTLPSMRELIEFNQDSGLYTVEPNEWDDWLQARIDAVRDGDIPPTHVVRGDGSVIRHQCVALPDGGRMLTYFDNTEISQARDKAQTALEDLKNAQQRLVQAEKMASLGQLTAGIAHEIKNPLNFVNNFSKLSAEMMEELAEILTDPMAALNKDDREEAEDLIVTVRENLLKIDQHGRRADSIVKNMLLHSREGSNEMQRVDLNALTKEGVNLAYHGARAADKGFNVDLAVELSDDVGTIECLPQDLQRVILNLCSNGMYEAAKKADSGGDPARLKVSTTLQDSRYLIEVSDNGDGIPAEMQDKIFNPFFTTKPSGEGTGLGLSISFDIIKQHGGELSFETQPGNGTTFIVALPVTTYSDK